MNPLPTGIDTQYHALPQRLRKITFLTTNNKNGVLVGVDNDGICGRFVHIEQEIKIVVHGSLIPTDTLHRPAGQ